MTLYFVDSSGNYLGGFDGAQPPEGAIEVPNPPNHGLDIWANGAWVSYVPTPSLLDQLYALFLTLSIPSQVQYAPFIGTVHVLITGNHLLEAKTLIASLTVSPQDQSIQSQMVALFP
jgi:hypothetical protein